MSENLPLETFAPRRAEITISAGGLDYRGYLIEGSVEEILAFEAKVASIPVAQWEALERAVEEGLTKDLVAERMVMAKDKIKAEILASICKFDGADPRPTKAEFLLVAPSVKEAIIARQKELSKPSEVLGESRDLITRVEAQVLRTLSTPANSGPEELPSTEPSGSSVSVTS